MRISRRHVLELGAGAAALGMVGSRAAAQSATDGGWSGGGIRSLGESLVAEPKYQAGFAHFDYVNPDAPKGGLARLEETGRYDTFNLFNVKGTPAGSIGHVVETLMKPSMDEGSTHYGLLAEWTERAADYSWVAFRLRDEARWHDGEPVTVADVQKSYELLTTKGRPHFRFYYQNVTEVVDEGDRIVLFRFDQSGNRELPHIMGQLYVMPAHFWETRDFAETTREPLLGSGPYKVGDYELGRFIEYERVADYWGKDLPLNVGSYNFDKIRYEYFQDRDIAFEAFKSGQVDFWDENSAKRWTQKYDFPAIKDGKVAKKYVDVEGPKATQFFAFNTRKPIFADRRARQAFSLAFDFEWSNEKVFYGEYARPSSYFQGSTGMMASETAPTEAELALLEPFRDQLPPELFEAPFANPVTDGSGQSRRQLRKATKLLREAGFEVKDKRLFLPDGSPAVIEFLSVSALQKPVVDPFLRNLEILGVEASFRAVDGSQYIARVQEFDFDMIVGGVANSESPGNEQRDYWASDAADRPGGRNVAGVKNPVVDALIDKIIFAEDREALETASRALDRVLLWEHYTILELYQPRERIAYWDVFGAPDPLPSRSVGFPSVWWYDADKAKAVRG